MPSTRSYFPQCGQVTSQSPRRAMLSPLLPSLFLRDIGETLRYLRFSSAFTQQKDKCSCGSNTQEAAHNTHCHDNTTRTPIAIAHRWDNRRCSWSVQHARNEKTKQCPNEKRAQQRVEPIAKHHKHACGGERDETAGAIRSGEETESKQVHCCKAPTTQLRPHLLPVSLTIGLL